MAKYGLAADNLLAVELVTADGEILNVTADSHPDLFWALRGGGGNFGVAASFDLPAAPARDGHRRPDRASDRRCAGDMLRFYRDAVADCLRRPHRLRRRSRTRPTARACRSPAMIVFHTGAPEEAERDLAPFKEWGSPMVVNVGPMPYPVMNTILDDGFPTGSLNYWLSSFTSGLPDELIDPPPSASRPCPRR